MKNYRAYITYQNSSGEIHNQTWSVSFIDEESAKNFIVNKLKEKGSRLIRVSFVKEK